jgi:hypothetical protein
VITEIINDTGDGAGKSLEAPRGIAVDESGNVYVAGGDSDNALKITPGGVITEIINDTGDGAGKSLKTPVGIAVDRLGNVYVSGSSSDNAFQITPSGMITEIINNAGDGAGHVLDNPSGIAVDRSGNVYVSGSSSNNAFRITPRGMITEIINENSLKGPVGGSVTNNAFRITPSGVITEIIDEDGAGPGKLLKDPRGIAVDGMGDVYVTGGIAPGSSDNAFKVPAAPMNCDDGNPCTDESCHPELGCVTTYNTGPCGDGSDTECTDPETCDGAGSCLPNDVEAGTTCGDPSSDECDNADTCDGSGNCQANTELTTTLCRAGGVCDEAEFCDGAGSCPADELTSDINQSGRADGFDLVILAKALGSSSGGSRFADTADLVKDGIIDGMDVDKLTQFFGCE